MGYVIALCIVVLAAFVCTAVVLGRDGGEREARVFTELEPELLAQSEQLVDAGGVVGRLQSADD